PALPAIPNLLRHKTDMKLIPDVSDTQVKKVRHTQSTMDSHREKQVVPEVPDFQVILNSHDHIGIADRLDFSHRPSPHQHPDDRRPNRDAYRQPVPQPAKERQRIFSHFAHRLAYSRRSRRFFGVSASGAS